MQAEQGEASECPTAVQSVYASWAGKGSLWEEKFAYFTRPWVSELTEASKRQLLSTFCMFFLEIELLEMTRKWWDWNDPSLYTLYLGHSFTLANGFSLGQDHCCLNLEQNRGKFIRTEDKANNSDILLDKFSSWTVSWRHLLLNSRCLSDFPSSFFFFF